MHPNQVIDFNGQPKCSFDDCDQAQIVSNWKTVFRRSRGIASARQHDTDEFGVLDASGKDDDQSHVGDLGREAPSFGTKPSEPETTIAAETQGHKAATVRLAKLIET